MQPCARLDVVATLGRSAPAPIGPPVLGCTKRRDQPDEIPWRHRPAQPGEQPAVVIRSPPSRLHRMRPGARPGRPRRRQRRSGRDQCQPCSRERHRARPPAAGSRLPEAQLPIGHAVGDSAAGSSARGERDHREVGDQHEGEALRAHAHGGSTDRGGHLSATARSRRRSRNPSGPMSQIRHSRCQRDVPAATASILTCRSRDGRSRSGAGGGSSARSWRGRARGS